MTTLKVATLPVVNQSLATEGKASSPQPVLRSSCEVFLLMKLTITVALSLILWSHRMAQWSFGMVRRGVPLIKLNPFAA